MIWAVSQKLLEGTGAGLEPQAYGTVPRAPRSS